jgi:hypothetical protein
MGRKKGTGFVGFNKQKQRWFARITRDGKDTTKFGISKDHAEWLLQCLRSGITGDRSDYQRPFLPAFSTNIQTNPA